MYINSEILLLYVNLIFIASVISSLLTQAIKKWCKNANKNYSPNLIALINAVLVGGGGTIAVFIYNNTVIFTIQNITTIICMVILTWIGSLIGFDKVRQTFQQILNMRENNAGKE